MRPLRVLGLVVGTLLIIPALAVLIVGGVLGMAHAFGREDGYFEANLNRLETDTVAITAEEIDLLADPGSPGGLIDVLDADVRLRATAARSDRALFVGIGPEAEVDEYLAGVAHAEIDDLDDDLAATFRLREGGDAITPPGGESFWVASSEGLGTQELVWEATDGLWAVVIMNADGEPGVSVDTDVGVKAGFVLPLAITLAVVGTLLTAAALAIILGAASGAVRSERTPPESSADNQIDPVISPPGDSASSPVRLAGALDPGLSRFLWLVKWFLAIPHFLLLFMLWVAFAVLTVVAGVSILFTGRYPKGIFDFNLGVLRWTWRVTFYAGSGGLGTDRYPPFSLDEEPDYPATLDVRYPEKLSRSLVLVKWWLLVLPHYVIVGLLVGSFGADNDGWVFGGGIVGFLTLVAGVTLLFTGRFPAALFDLIVGLNRWVMRVVAYAALMTDDYPPFRLDQGGEEPKSAEPPPAPPQYPTADGVDLRELSQNPKLEPSAG